jgi:hypothetical protein
MPQTGDVGGNGAAAAADRGTQTGIGNVVSTCPISGARLALDKITQPGTSLPVGFTARMCIVGEQCGLLASGSALFACDNPVSRTQKRSALGRYRGQRSSVSSRYRRKAAAGASGSDLGVREAAACALVDELRPSHSTPYSAQLAFWMLSLRPA